MNNVPFKRARLMFSAIAAIVSGIGSGVAGLLTQEQRDKLATLGDYRSRGKGGGHSFMGRSRNTVAQARRASKKRRNQLKNKAAHRKAA